MKTDTLKANRKNVLSPEELLTSFSDFEMLVKHSGLKDDKIMEELGMTRPTLKKYKKEPQKFSVEHLDKLALLFTNGKTEITTASLVEFIRVKYLN